MGKQDRYAKPTSKMYSEDRNTFMAGFLYYNLESFLLQRILVITIIVPTYYL